MPEPERAHDERVVIVTGASKGIGRAIARAFATDGARVVVSSRDEQRCQLVVDEIREHGGSAIAVAAHMGRPDAVDALFASTLAEFGGVDVVVNNAATNPTNLPLFETPDEVVVKVFAVNVIGPLQLARHAAMHMAEHDGGAILNIVSKSAFAPEEHLGPYAASKAALVTLTKVMAREWAPYGVRVNAIAPGPFATTMVADLFAQDEYRDALLRSTAQHRIADPDEIVGAARFLTGRDASFVTGAVLHVDGGRLP
jgi:NAD(P)-dependent dehydrogenase (short-subunit alcohol dehydrogenase family)